MSISTKHLHSVAGRLASLLKVRGVRVVFAESCTAGLVAASLARTPGISQWLCGSAVVYRDATKAAWLGISASELKRHSAVSDPVARGMAVGVLRATREAEWSASVTGHLGPDSPVDQDGVVFVSIACRRARKIELVSCEKIRLRAKSRSARQVEASFHVCERLHAALTGGVDEGVAKGVAK
ncbi:MAG: Nicotinamide-nucleotide amidohydrolase PncC [Planctomycetota bacterium]